MAIITNVVAAQKSKKGEVHVQLIRRLVQKNQIIDILLANLAQYKVQAQAATHAVPAGVSLWDTVLVGSHPHQTQVTNRLEFISFLFQQAGSSGDIQLSKQHVCHVMVRQNS